MGVMSRLHSKQFFNRVTPNTAAVLLITIHTSISPLPSQDMKIVGILMPLLLLACNEILTSEALVLSNFYPFGQSEGDLLMPEDDDGSSEAVPISIPFPFFDQNQNSLFVSIQL